MNFINPRKLSIAAMILFMSATAFAQEDKIPTGWSFGGVPAIAYNSDTGFMYGIVLNTYNYGDGSTYPDYKYTINTTWTRTTKGSGENTLFFDSKYLLPGGIRITSELSYLTEQALPFYGFNGFESQYNSAFEDQEDDNYITRVFYRHERNIFKLTSDFQGKLLKDNLRWIGGAGYWNTEVGSVDVATLNKGQDEVDKLPVYENPDSIGLYDQFRNDGVISGNEVEGGNTNYIKLGVVFDTRDNEPNPMSGMWTEVLLTAVPGFLGNDFSYQTLTATHRQYFTIRPRNLSFAYRIGFQKQLGDDVPFFMLPFYQGSFKTTEGLGGSKSLRGILKNRIVGAGIGFANMEVRWKFYRTIVFGQNLYLAINTFLDAGKVITPFETPVDQPENTTEEKLHLSYGAGFRIAMNENFIIAIDYGMAGDEQDGSSGLYIGLGYLY